MTCEEIRERIDALVDGELTGSERRRVERHLSDCVPCRGELARRRELVTLAGELPVIQPQRDLWPEVAARIGASADRRRAATRWGLLATAAALAIALLAPLALRRDATPPEPAAVAAIPDAARADIARWHDGTTRTHSDLQAELARQRAMLPPGVLDRVEDDVATLDQAVAQLSAALEEDPFNRRLSSLLAHRYQQEAEMVKRISRI